MLTYQERNMVKNINIDTISPATIGKLIEAFQENNREKFLAYAEFIAEKYEKAGSERAAHIIRSRVDGSYEYQAKATLG